MNNRPNLPVKMKCFYKNLSAYTNMKLSMMMYDLKPDSERIFQLLGPPQRRKRNRMFANQHPQRFGQRQWIDQGAVNIES